MLNVDEYLKRLNYQGSRAPNAKTLKALHLAHLCAVPFENLSRFHGPPVELTSTQLFQKVVVGRRGGFCYELNGLFAELLKSLGFEVTLLAAGVHRSVGAAILPDGAHVSEYGPDFDHLVLLVRCEQDWLVDVGFGSGFRYPLLLNENGDQLQETDSYRLSVHGEYVILSRMKQGEEWKPLYRFKKIPRKYADYFEMCDFHATSPDSPFSKHKIVRLETSQGRVSLMDNNLTIATNGTEREVELSDSEYRAVLRDHFGIVV